VRLLNGVVVIIFGLEDEMERIVFGDGNDMMMVDRIYW